MQRIATIDPDHIPEATAKLLDAVKAQMGGVPNILATMAQSSAALGGYLGLAGALGGGRLSPATREQVALAVAGVNGCDYCASAHATLGKQHGLEADEMTLNLAGRSADPKTAAALGFVARVLATRGHVTDGELADVRAAGFTDAEIVELVAHTALNVFTNYFNHVAGTEIDFPVVRTGGAVAA